MEPPPFPARKNLRLPSYDYSRNGAYFVTVCLKPRLPLFGAVRRGGPCGRPESSSNRRLPILIKF